MTLSESGILLIDKPPKKTSFYLVHALRKITGISKIGHTGTLDPLATGVMVMLIGRSATRLSSQMVGHDKIYETSIRLGVRTTTFDDEGVITDRSEIVPSLSQIEDALLEFQGSTRQIPPMYSAKKVAGQKLYELARKGVEIERAPINVWMKIDLIDYQYPLLTIRIHCSSGTYIRTLADDIGTTLGCFGSVSKLCRLKSGPFSLEDCLPLDQVGKQTIVAYNQNFRSLSEIVPQSVLCT